MSAINRQQFHEKYGPGHAIEPMPDARQTNQDIITALADHIKPERVLEIGVNVGETARAILSDAPYIKEYIGVDLPKMWFKGKASDKPGQIVDDDRLKVMTPEGGSRGIDKSDLGKFDLIFIDGDHTYAGVEFDTRLAYALLNPGGVVIWHDYGRASDLDVTSLVHYLNLKEREGRICAVMETWTAFEIIPSAKTVKEAPEPKPLKKSRKKDKEETETL